MSGALVHEYGLGCISPRLGVLFDTDQDRHAEACHSVERVAGDFGLGPLIGESPGVKTPADDGLVSVHRGFNEAPPGISGTPLPANTPLPCDRLEMLVALCGRTLAQNAVDRGGMLTAASGWHFATAS